MSPIEQIKTNLKIADLIAESFTLTGRGRLLTTVEHDSLKIYTDTNTWYWYSQATGGDLLDWWQQQHRCSFDVALATLANKAGVELRPPTPEELHQRSEASARRAILQIAANHYHVQLKDNQAALDYCYGRGWNDGTITSQLIGYNPLPYQARAGEGSPADKPLLSVGDDQPLAKRLQAASLLDHPLAKAVLSLPAGHLVYVHRYQGTITYLSTRSIEGKRHWNLPAELAGPRPPYHALPAKPQRGVRVLVEGQADAISLAQLGLDAIALCGVAVGEASLSDISHVALDNDTAGQAKALDLALAIDPLCRLVTWPKEAKNKEPGKNHVAIKDANDLLKCDFDINAISAILEDAPTAIQVLASKASKEKDKDLRKEMTNRFFALYSGLDKIDQADRKNDLAQRLCGGMSQFQRIWKAYQEANKQDEKTSSGGYVIYSAGGTANGHVFEQVLCWRTPDIADTAYAIRWPDGKVTTKATLDIEDVTYIPYSPRRGLIRKKAIKFAEKPEEYGTQRQLVDEIRQFIHAYVDIDGFYEKLSTYYAMFTWMYDCFEVLPYLRALGDHGCGKSRLLRTVGSICYRPMFTSGGSSVSSVFRMLDLFGGTLVMDEADFTNSDTDAEIVKLLNVGFQRGGFIMRSEKEEGEGDDLWPVVKDVFGPKILATRKLFVDRAVESRCLTRYMPPIRPRSDIPEHLDEEFEQRALRLRNKLLMYRLKNHRVIQIDRKLSDVSVEPRLNQVAIGLKAIVDDPEMVEDINQFVRAYNAEMIEERNMGEESAILQAVADLYQHYSAGNDAPVDLDMAIIADMAQKIMVAANPEAKITAQKVQGSLRSRLGMKGRGKPDGHTRRIPLQVTRAELEQVMKRYGVTWNILDDEHPQNEATKIEGSKDLFQEMGK